MRRLMELHFIDSIEIEVAHAAELPRVEVEARELILARLRRRVAGGACGIAIGWAATKLLSSIAGWTTSVTPASALLALGFSATIGVVFGIFPARKAALLNPIEALRYE
jgi:hypothetical protein